jgi:hypothetical protein
MTIRHIFFNQGLLINNNEIAISAETESAQWKCTLLVIGYRRIRVELTHSPDDRPIASCERAQATIAGSHESTVSVNWRARHAHQRCSRCDHRRCAVGRCASLLRNVRWIALA